MLKIIAGAAVGFSLGVAIAFLTFNPQLTACNAERSKLGAEIIRLNQKLAQVAATSRLDAPADHTKLYAAANAVAPGAGTVLKMIDAIPTPQCPKGYVLSFNANDSSRPCLLTGQKFWAPNVWAPIASH